LALVNHYTAAVYCGIISLGPSRWNGRNFNLEEPDRGESIGRSQEDSEELQTDAVWRFTRFQ